MSMKKGEVEFKEYVYDFAVDGGATGVLALRSADPNAAALEEGTLVRDVIVVNEKALTGGSTLILGTGADDNGFMVDMYAAVTALGATVRAGELDGDLIWDSTADAKKAYRVGSAANTKTPQMTIGTAALTAGKLRVILELYKPGSLAGVV